MKQLCCAFLFVYFACSDCLGQPHDYQNSDTSDATSKATTTDKTAKADSGKPAATGDAADKESSTDKGSADASKTPFDEGSYAQATALTYQAMQETAAIIARNAPVNKPENNDMRKAAQKDSKSDRETGQPTNTFVIFDAPAFSAINEYRIVGPQISLLKRGLYEATLNASPRKPPKSTTVSEWSSAVPGFDVINSSVDAIEKILKLMQTETTVKGAGVNITDAALIAEVSEQLEVKYKDATPPIAIYYPGQYLAPKMDEEKLQKLFTASRDDLSKPQGSVTLDVIALGQLRVQAQAVYNNLDKSITAWDVSEKERITLDAKSEPAKADEKEKFKNQKQTKTKDQAGILGALPGPDVDVADRDAIVKKVNAAKMAATTLKSYLDSCDALIKGLGTPDNKGQTWLTRLATAETLDDLVKNPSTQVLMVRWLRAGALNKTRKNLFFLGTRTYYGGGATALYEYYDHDQHLERSGTVTATARYVHDTTFDKGIFNGTVRCLDLAKNGIAKSEQHEENYSCPKIR